jgi:hypothetical protein
MAVKPSACSQLTKPKPPRIWAAFVQHIYASLITVVFIGAVILEAISVSARSSLADRANERAHRQHEVLAAAFLHTTHSFQFRDEANFSEDCGANALRAELRFENYLSQIAGVISIGPGLIEAYRLSFGNGLILETETFCSRWRDLDLQPGAIVAPLFDGMSEIIATIRERVQSETMHYLHSPMFICVCLVASVGYLFVVGCKAVHVWMILKDGLSEFSQYFEFLGSPERADLALAGKVTESWELLGPQQSDHIDEIELGGVHDTRGYSRDPRSLLMRQLLYDICVWIAMLPFFVQLAFNLFSWIDRQAQARETFDRTAELTGSIIKLEQIACFRLLNLSSSLAEGRRIAAVLGEADHEIGRLFRSSAKDQRHPDSTITIENLTMSFLTNSLHPDQTMLDYLPRLLVFAEEVLKDRFISDASQREEFHVMAPFAFCRVWDIVAVICAYFGLVGYRSEVRLVPRLFLFPIACVDKPAHKERLLPEMLLVITVIRDTHKIYAVSDTVTKILNKSALSLIDMSFSDLFVSTDDHENDILILVSPDKTRHRRFRVREANRGCFTDMILFEDVNALIGAAHGASLSSQLGNFLVPTFADYFSAGLGTELVIRSGFYIFFRADPTVPANSAEAFFAGFLSLAKSFQNIRIVQVAGCSIIVALPGIDSIACLFFLRNAIFTRNIGANLTGVLLDHRLNIRFSLDFAEEPFVECDDEELNQNMLRLAFLGKGTVGVCCSDRLPPSFQNLETLPGAPPTVTLFRLPEFIAAVDALIQ